MPRSHSLYFLLKGLWFHVKRRRRVQFVLVFFLMLLASFAEILSLGAVLPFLTVLTNSELVFHHPFARPVISVLRITSSGQLILPLTIIFGTAALLSGGMRLLMLWASTKVSHVTGADLSIKVYRHTLYQPYATHVSRNSSEIISGINKVGGVTSAFMSIFTLSSSGIIFLSIFGTLLAVDPVIALSSFVGFGGIYAVIILLTRNRLFKSGQIIANEANRVVKALQEGIGGIRDILIDGSQESYCQIYSHSAHEMRKAQASNAFLGNSPRFAVEALGMVLIAGLAYSMSKQPEGLSNAIPVLGALAFGAQRMLPLLQQFYASWSGLLGQSQSLQDVLLLLDQKMPEYAVHKTMQPLPFREHISIEKLSFRYGDSLPFVLKDLDVTIERGSRVGFIGATGSGKSTLLDIIMGLLHPTEGQIVIDDTPITDNNFRAWQAHIAHVPQSIFLADTTIAENIAFGVPKELIDIDQVRKAAREAQIADTIEEFPKKYKTLVGERGVRLSGGQRQRIGIARALYKQTDVIVFDEATSALDNATEQSVMKAIENLSKDLTVLIIAHRLTTLQNCDKIIDLKNGMISRLGTYDEIIAKKGSSYNLVENRE